MIVCNSKLYITGYVLSKFTSILQSMARLLSFHVLSCALNYVYVVSTLWINTMAHFCGIDIHDWIVRFLDLWTSAVRFHFSINIFFTDMEKSTHWF